MTESTGINMSLDDYIAKSHIQRPMQAQKYQSSSSVPDRFRRCEEDKEESDDDMGEDIWRGPSSSTNFLDLDCKTDKEVVTDCFAKDQTTVVEIKEDDLRHRISGPLPDLKSQQWRLLYPNNNPERRSGIPPLVPQHLLNSIRSNANQCQGRNRKRFRGPRNGGNGYGNGNSGNRPYFPNNNFNNNFRNYNNNNNRNGMNNSWKFDMNRNMNSNMNSDATLRSNTIDLNSQIGFNLLNQGLGALLRQNLATNNDATNLSITQNGSDIDLTHNAPLSRFEVNRPTTSIDAAARANFLIDNQKIASNGNSAGIDSKNTLVKSLIGMNDKDFGNIPMMATKFMDFLNGGCMATHQPIYDMKVQKEIHNMQEKPLIYKKSDTPVIISSDGAGIDCEIIPRSSGISMNYRFT